MSVDVPLVAVAALEVADIVLGALALESPWSATMAIRVS